MLNLDEITSQTFECILHRFCPPSLPLEVHLDRIFKWLVQKGIIKESKNVFLKYKWAPEYVKTNNMWNYHLSTHEQDTESLPATRVDLKESIMMAIDPCHFLSLYWIQTQNAEFWSDNSKYSDCETPADYSKLNQSRPEVQAMPQEFNTPLW